MTMFVTTEVEMQRLAPPNLPLAPKEYTPQYVEQLNNVLRLYFNRLQDILNQLNVDANSSGATLSFPSGVFHQDGTTALTGAMTNVSTTPIAVTSTTGFPPAGLLLIESELVQYTGVTSTTFTGITRGVKSSTNVAHSIGAAVTEAQGITVGTASPFYLTVTDYSNDVSLSSSYRVNFAKDGWYDIQFSIQFLNLSTSEDNATIWLRKNGTDVANSAGIVQVPQKHGSYPGASIAGWNVVIDVVAGDYIELYWHSDLGYAVAATYPAGTTPVHPVSPSLILTATFVSAIV